MKILNAEAWYNDFIKSLKIRKEEVIDRKNKLLVIRRMLEIICFGFSISFTAIGLILSSIANLSTITIVIYTIICVITSFVIFNVLNMTYKSIDDCNKRLRDLDNKLENTTYEKDTATRFRTMKFASDHNWFLDSLEEMEKL